MKTPSMLIPLFKANRTGYDSMSDSKITGLWQFCIRIRLGWSLLRCGWRTIK